MASDLLTSSTDLSAYAARIGYTGDFEPTLETLTAVVTAHGDHIPFENLNPLMGRPVVDLSRDALFDKMVRHRRGGYCYEQNGLLRYLLSDMGFDVTVMTGRVVYQVPEWETAQIARTHQVSVVRIPGVDGSFLVDVGFGGQTLTSPIRLVVDEVQRTRHEPYRLRTHHGDGFLLEADVAGSWRPLYIFDETPQQLIDLEVGSWYVSTHPTSHFTTGLSVALVADGERWNLRGRNLAIHRVDGPGERIRFDNASQVLDALVNRFGLDVGGLGDVHKRITEVLDT